MAEESTVTLSDKLAKIAEQIEGLNVLELSELAKYLEEKFGVSGMPMMAAGPAVGGAASTGAAEPAEEKTEFTVELAEAGANKLAVIKAVREIVPTLGLIDAKKLVESAPKPVVENAKKEAAEEAKKKLEAAGAKVTLK